MMIYAERRGRVIRQVVSDVLAVAWLVLWGYAAAHVHDQVSRLRTPGQRLELAGVEIRGALTAAAERAGRVPLVGDDLAEALRGGAGAGDTLRGAGRTQITAVEDLATLLAVFVVVIPLLFLLLTWLPPRLRFVLAARSARRLRGIGARDLLALRALTRLSARRLARFGGDPAVGWRDGDPEVIRRLAAAELDAHGLRPPGPATRVRGAAGSDVQPR